MVLNNTFAEGILYLTMIDDPLQEIVSWLSETIY